MERNGVSERGREGSYADEVAARVRAVVAGAEADADALRERARRDAERLVAERRERIAAASDALLARSERLLEGMRDAEALRGQVDELVRALAEAAERIAADAGAAPGAAARPDAAPPPEAAPPPDGARLVAAELAAAGRSREAIEAELRAAFGVGDPGAIVADVLAERAAGRLGGAAR